MHWHFRLFSLPNKAYLAGLTMHLACAYSSFWLISNTIVEQRSVIRRFCENQVLNSGEMQVSAPAEGTAAAQEPCWCWAAEGRTGARDQLLRREHLQDRLPLGWGETGARKEPEYCDGREMRLCWKLWGGCTTQTCTEQYFKIHSVQNPAYLNGFLQVSCAWKSEAQCTRAKHLAWNIKH